MTSDTTVERISDRELAATRTFDAPARHVFAAWSKAELFRRWWVPASFPIKLVGCEMDVRVGGTYRLTFEANGQLMDFFGEYVEVVPDKKLVWSNDEGGPETRTFTTVTFEELGGRTRLTMTELHGSKEALDASMDASAMSAAPETFEQLATTLPSITA